MLHKWIIDVYLQTSHRSIKDTPAHRWHSDVTGLPPPLPPSASELDVVLEMIVRRVVFHYGIELAGLKYNSPELGELQRRVGQSAKVELTFDPGDLGQINVLDPLKGIYIRVPAEDQTYAKGLSLWQNKVIRHYVQRQLNTRTDVAALEQAKVEIRELVERDFNRKSTRGRKRHARFMADHTSATTSEAPALQPAFTMTPGDEDPRGPEARPRLTETLTACQKPSPEVRPAPTRTSVALDTFTDDEILPVFEAGLDLPRARIAAAIAEEEVTAAEESR